MRAFAPDRIERWARRVGIIAVAGLAWAVLAPGGVLWTAVLAAGLTGSALVIVAIAGERRAPVLAPVAASARRARRVRSARGDAGAGAKLRPRGEGTP